MRAASTTSFIPWARGSEILLRAMVIGAYFLLWSAGYYFTNAWGSDPSRSIHLVRPCDVWPEIIQPWTAIIYVFGGFVLPLLPFYFNWGWSKLRYVLVCYTICSVVAFSCYLVWPLSIVRPSFAGPGLGRWLMQQVLKVDNEANCFPSSHVYYAVLGALLVRHGGAGRPAQWATYVLAAAVCATTVTTGQHYFLDIAGGVAVAILSYLITQLLLPDRVGGRGEEGKRRRGEEEKERRDSRLASFLVVLKKGSYSVSKSLRNLFVDLSPSVFAFALLIGAGCSPSAKPPTPAVTADEPALPKTALHAADEPPLPKNVPRVADEPGLPKPPPHALAKEWYSPRESDFRPEYDRDAVNQAKESWSDYWSWVQTFYQGNLFSPGWTAQGTASLNGVGSETARDELRSDLNELGRRVAAEWSKDNGVRKIDTAALRVLGGRITKAAKRDGGSGGAIKEELQAIRAEVDARLSGR